MGSNQPTNGKAYLSRRSFLKGAGSASIAGIFGITGATLAASTLAACTPTDDPVPPNQDDTNQWDKEVDIIVVGFGGAGGAAAIEAYDNQAGEILILEKTATPGGCTTLSAGIFYAANTTLQKLNGITDSADDMYKYLMIMGNGLNSPELSKVYADKSAETFAWMESLGSVFYDTGVNLYGGIPVIKPPHNDDTSYGLYYSGGEPDPIPASVVPPVPRGHIVRPVEPNYPYPPINPGVSIEIGPTRGTGYFKPLWDGVASRGIEVMLETRATKLIMDNETGEVIGLEAIQATIPTTDLAQLTDYSNGKSLRIKARKAVVLTAGGHSQNKEFNKIFCQEAVYPERYNASDTGDGIIMGMQIGAGTINLDQTLLSVSVTRGAILVNQGGRRFTDETVYRVAAEDWYGSFNSKAWDISDSTMYSATTFDFSADTIEELAEKIVIDPATLRSTVDYYNESVAQGYDREFGKTKITRNLDTSEAAALKPISTPPFYANERIPDRSLVSGQGITMGGLRIDEKARVLKITGTETIGRLYAAGSNSGGLFGDCYPGSGAAIAQALIFGRIAGANAAEEESRG